MTGADLKSVRAERLWGFDFLLFRVKFVEQYGQIRYVTLAGLPRQQRTKYITNPEWTYCEFPECLNQGPYGRIIYDHCHRHDIVRGLLCGNHNSLVGKVEAVMNLNNVAVDLRHSPFGLWLRNCFTCNEEGLGVQALW